MPTWVLALTFWLHFLAVVTWIGSLVSIYVLVVPASRRTLQPVDQLALIENIQKRLEPIAWFSISLLIVTGLFQMSVNPHYNGFLSTSGQWSLAILAKHALVATLIAVSAVHTWDVLPAIRRALMRKDKIDAEQLSALQRRETRLLQTCLVLAALILLATAFARAA
jgi:copper resistance protein D